MLEKLLLIQSILTLIILLLFMNHLKSHNKSKGVDNIRPATDTRIIKKVKPPVSHGECTTLYTPSNKPCPGPPPKQPPKGGSNVPPKPTLNIIKRCECTRPCCKYRDDIEYNCKGEKVNEN